VEWLNYHHLLYFHATVRAGTLAAAARQLRLAPPTVHAQIRALEEQLGEPLLVRRGRTLVPTDAGRLVFSYADRIFGLGRELMDAVKQRPVSTPLRLAAGIDDVLPKEIAHALLAPALALERPVRLLCHEGSLEPLLARLALHELDVVLSDAPVTPGFPVRAYNHLLGETAVVWMAERRVAAAHHRGFPKSLDGAPVLLPTDDTAIRRDLDQWCDRHGVRPQVVAEFEDYGLLREFGQRGAGVFPVPAALERELARRYGLRRVGAAKGVVARFYAVTIDRQIRHPASAAIAERGRGGLAATLP
jgi:LysR family transcriptional regulator, transcriptional activator of nhaA